MKDAPGTPAATALVIASMIGTGVFVSLGFQLLDLDSAPQILLLWLLGGLIALCGALCYAAIAEAFPRSGGEHHFLGQLYHPSLGFMAGTLSALSGFAAPTAITAMAFGAYLNKAFPAVPPTAAAVAVILVGSAAHAFDARTSARVQTAATALKLLLILGFLATAFALPGEGDIRWSPVPAEDLPAIASPAFAVALVWVLYAYSGWNAAVYGLESWDRPRHTVRRALVIGTLIVTTLYIALNAAFLKAAPVASLRGVHGEITVGEIAAVSLYGKTAGTWVSSLFALGLFASVSAMLWAGPHVLAAMGRSTPSLGFFAPKHGAPRLGLLVQVVVALILVGISAFDDLVTFTTIGLTISTMLTVAGVFRLPPGNPRPVVAAVVFLAMTTFIVLYSIIQQTLPSVVGLATVVVLTAAGHLIHRHSR